MKKDLVEATPLGGSLHHVAAVDSQVHADTTARDLDAHGLGGGDKNRNRLQIGHSLDLGEGVLLATTDDLGGNAVVGNGVGGRRLASIGATLDAEFAAELGKDLAENEAAGRVVLGVLVKRVILRLPLEAVEVADDTRAVVEKSASGVQDEASSSHVLGSREVIRPLAGALFVVIKEGREALEEGVSRTIRSGLSRLLGLGDVGTGGRIHGCVCSPEVSLVAERCTA